MNTNEYYDKEERRKSRDNPVTSNNMKFTFSLILVLVVMLLLFLYFNKNTSGDEIVLEPSITLSENNIRIEEGTSYKLLYKVNNYNEDLNVNFISGNTSIVTIDNEGNIKAVKEGSTKIMAIYFIDDISYKKECLVTVTGSEEVITDHDKPVINVKFSSGGDNIWTNQTVILTIDTKDASKVTTYYASNCVNNCEYLKVLDNTLTINNSNQTIISLKAVDEYNNVEYKTVTVKIDRDIPKIEGEYNSTIYSNEDYTVCYKCTDTTSGCKEENVCKTYTKTATNQTLKLYDNVGNYAETNSFNVIIDKTKPTCILDLDTETNTLTARVTEKDSGIEYQGFDSNYKDTSTSKIVSSEGTYTYYVKDKAGNTNSCSEELLCDTSVIKCETGYTNYSSKFGTETPCAKLLGAAGWSSYTKTSEYEYVESCTNTLSSSIYSYAFGCEYQINKTLCGTTANSCYKKVKYTRVRNVCTTGTLSGTYCYDLKKAVCDKYFIGRG